MNKIFGLDFYDKGLSELVKSLDYYVSNDRKATVFTPNVDHVINNKIDSVVNDLYSQSEYIIADGWPLVATARMKKIRISRITGVDLMDRLLELADNKRLNVFFLGATNETLDKLKGKISDKYPNIKSISCYNGFFENNNEVINQINLNKNHILFVGMGNPKQEIWIRENYMDLSCNIVVGVGGAFKIFSEEVKRAPKWIQKIGMEWFYRFLKEPRRLFMRYFVKYPRFIKIMISELGKSN